ncbi:MULTISPECIES: DNA repair protein RadA [Janibacter]|uniref:DNA repair protein RadA n=1 Tax=Janibacter melonis TaxID=262209 RepID=A0A5P8FJZ8_9MICO|nr:DNA repair protein RadA [Janibacter melonis]MBD5829755.1 DNA repair protein RadA [Janibacter melonis]MCB5992569.1 DNA repair protein RadA [Janibacter melonis]QFQ29491.1 DNA repair protein RadA [Janibacter melonis]
MAATKSPGYRCSECGWTTVKWVGRCGECQAWGTLVEIGAATVRTTAARRVERSAQPIAQVAAEDAQSWSTGVGEFDRVLGGGIVPGSVVLVAGEPGIGKSTLLLDVAARAAAHRPVLYVSGEESAAQVRARAQRIGALADELYLTSETDLGTVLAHLDERAPALAVVDSVQTLASGEVDGAAGNVSQVREVAGALIQRAKAAGIAMLLVGHVTKDGSIAGPRMLEHLVDVVVQFDGDRHSRLRLVRAVKNRYGPTDEVGCFDLTDTGIHGLEDPSGLFLSSRHVTVPGTCATVTLEGRRPLVTEIQALVAPSEIPTPRRASVGLDSSRVAMIMAVLDRRAGAPVGRADTYVSTVGGVRITEPSSDLAVALAIASAVQDRPLPHTLLALGEVGLSGEVRPAVGVSRRLLEASRLGFTTALVPVGALADSTPPPRMEVVEVSDLSSAIEQARSRSSASAPAGT